MSESTHKLGCLKSQAYGTGCSCGVEPVASPQATRPSDNSSLPLDYVQRYGIAKAAQPAGTTDDDGSVSFTFDERTQVLRYLAMNARGMHWPINWDAEIVKRVLEKIQPAIGLTESEATTPQAERLHPHGCYCNDCYSKQYLHSRRAVAPVETPCTCNQANGVCAVHPEPLWPKSLGEYTPRQIVAVHAIITPACRANRGPEEALEEAFRRIRGEYRACQNEANQEANFHVLLTVERLKT